MMKRRPTTVGRVGILATTALLAATALTGCGDDGDKSSSEPSSELSLDTTQSPTSDLPDGVPTEEPEAPSGLSNSPADAKAYAIHAFEEFQYATLRNDFETFLALGTCPSCANSIAAAKKLDRQGRYEIYDRPVTMRSIQPFYVKQGVHVFGVSFDVPPGKRVDQGGETVATLRGRKKKFMEIAVKYRGKRWELVDLAITD